MPNKAPNKKRSTFRKADVKRAFQAAKMAGVNVRIEISDGKITLIPDDGATDAAPPKPIDDWMASHARSIEGN